MQAVFVRGKGEFPVVGSSTQGDQSTLPAFPVAYLVVNFGQTISSRWLAEKALSNFSVYEEEV